MNQSVQTCPEPVAMPIVFVPGIMGSRLRRSSDPAGTKAVWDPDRRANGLWNAWNGAEGKRNALIGTPANAGFRSGFLRVDYGEVGGNLSQRDIDRNWGGLLQTFYGAFVSWMQNTAQQPASGQLPRGCSNVNYEVWAHPYNWTDDNTNSGRDLAATVDSALAGTKEIYDPRGIRVLKPVVVTHSMGGLVSRAFTQLHGGSGKVHGVIHGAMPTDGAPATYKRMLAGFEGNFGMAWIMRHALGANQRETTATAGNMPGALQLLPNTRHKSVDGSTDWLKCTDRSGSTRWSKPSGNPYAEIYVNQSDWWRLIYRHYLNPAGNERAALASFQQQLTKAARLHNSLGPSGFHPNTRMFYSDDRGFLAWDQVEWRNTGGSETPGPGTTLRNDNRGTMEWGTNELTQRGTRFDLSSRYELQEPDAPGDATVHSGSGRHVRGPMSVATSSGFEHADAFNPREVRTLVAEWLMDMVREQI